MTMALPSPPSLSFSALLALIRTPSPYTLYPIYQTLDADLDTPISIYLKLTRHHSSSSASSPSGASSPSPPPPPPPASFLLESVQHGEYQSRFSYIGTDPSFTLTQSDCDPLPLLAASMANRIPFPTPALPDFIGGAVGYVAYDCIGHWERKVPIPERNPLGLPQSVWMFCPAMVILDHVKQSLHVVSHVEVQQGERGLAEAELRQRYDEAVKRIAVLLERLAEPLPISPSAGPASPAASSPPTPSHSLQSSSSSSHHHGLTSNVGAEGYHRFVTALRDNIVEGNIIQAVPSQRLCRPLHPAVSAFDVYRSLRIVNPSPYMFFLDLGSYQIAGASPEQLVKVEKTGRVTTHPIAGTRRRGKTQEEDEALERELLASEKERAEHIMLVDLGRNDIGRVCIPGTVKVDSLMHVERYSHVMHIVSVVSGQLKPDLTVYDAFRAVFPAGTVSGAPKIRAMQLIAGLEQEQRGVYAGAVGFVSFSGSVDTAIAIRTLIVKDGAVYLQAGAGIVYDSVPAAEEKETVKKMMALVHAIEKSEAAAQHRIASTQTTVTANGYA